MEEKEKDESEESKTKDEVVFIQDIGFSVKIVSPGAESFDIQVCCLLLYVFIITYFPGNI